jgi:PKD repeat protein
VAIALAAPGAAMAVTGADPMVVVAGTGTGIDGTSGDGGPATSALLARPRAAAANVGGDIFIAQRTQSGVRLVRNGVISRFAGTYASGTTGDNGPALNAQVNLLSGIAVDPSGNVFIAEEGSGNVRKIDTAGIITTLAGGFNGVLGLATDAAGNVYAAAAGEARVFRISPAGTKTVLAGTGSSAPNGVDGIPATDSALFAPGGVAVDSANNVYIADGARVRKVTAATGVISTVAGNGTGGFAGDNGPATAAQIQAAGVAVDGAGNVYIAEGAAGNRIRRVDRSTGVITTIAGSTSGATGFTAATGPARDALLNTPFGVSVDSTGSLLIGDEGTRSVRRIVNAPPVAGFSATPASGIVPVAASFDASASNGGGNDGLIAFSWTFGDGTTGSGQNVSHTFGSPGTFTVKLTVMDESGATATTTRTVTVAAVPPGGLTLTKAGFQPRWSKSRLRGTLSITGVAIRAADLRVNVLKASGKGKALLKGRFRVAKAGPFTARIAAHGLVPGTFKVQVVDGGRQTPKLPTREINATLAGPPEGVVPNPFISTGLGGSARRSIAFGPSFVVSNFRFATLPRKGLPLKVVWHWSQRSKPIQQTKKRRARLIQVILKLNEPLPRGKYRADLVAGAKVVASAPFRIR